MSKLALASAVLALALGLGGPVFADPNPNSETTGQPGNGNQGCLVEDEAIVAEFGEDPFKNPGKALQAFREVLGQNPKDVIDASDDDVNLGQAIKENCGTPS